MTFEEFQMIGENYVFRKKCIKEVRKSATAVYKNDREAKCYCGRVPGEGIYMRGRADGSFYVRHKNHDWEVIYSAR